jgi:hypothetical protein
VGIEQVNRNLFFFSRFLFEKFDSIAVASLPASISKMFVLFVFVGLFARVASVVLQDWTSERPFAEVANAVVVGDGTQGAWNLTSKCVQTGVTFAQVLFTSPSPPPAFNVSMRATLDIRFPDPAEHYDGIYAVFGGIAGFHMKNTPGRMDVFMFTNPNITIFDPDSDWPGVREGVSDQVTFNETTSNRIRFVVSWFAGNVDFLNVTAFFVSDRPVANATIMSFVRRPPHRPGSPVFVPSVTASPFMLTTLWNARFCLRAWRVETLESLPAITDSSRLVSMTSTAAQTGSTASSSGLTSGTTRATSAASTVATSPPSVPATTASTTLATTLASTLTLPTVQVTSVSAVATTSGVSGTSTTDTGADLVLPGDNASPKEAEFPLGIVIGASVAGGVLLVCVIGALLFCVARRRARADVATTSIKDEQFTSARVAPPMQGDYAVLPSGDGATMQSAKSEYDSPAALKLHSNSNYGNVNYASGQLEADYASARM